MSLYVRVGFRIYYYWKSEGTRPVIGASYVQNVTGAEVYRHLLAF